MGRGRSKNSATFANSIVKQTVFHGTDAGNITEFKTSGRESNGAIFFSDSEDYAEEEAYIKDERTGNGRFMYEVNLNIQNPLRVVLSESEFADNAVEKKYIEKAKREGHDSVIFTSDTDNEYLKDTFYAVFDSKQIKIRNKRRL